LLGIDPIGDPLERDLTGPQLCRQAAGVLSGLGGRGPFHHDRDVVEVAELPRVLGVALDGGLALRKQVALRRLESEGGKCVDDARRRQQAREGQSPDWTGCDQPHQPTQQTPDRGHAHQRLVTPTRGRLETGDQPPELEALLIG
jgi:hypothetical protein